MLEDSMIVATVPVTDLDRAKRFYGETLGLAFLWENPASARFRCGGGTQVSVFRRAPSTADHTLAHRIGLQAALYLRSTRWSSMVPDPLNPQRRVLLR
jgi:catechol 2,3-dioxygenase-like lactoylglutathione lyase family enzyme